MSLTQHYYSITKLTKIVSSFLITNKLVQRKFCKFFWILTYKVINQILLLGFFIFYCIENFTFWDYRVNWDDLYYQKQSWCEVPMVEVCSLQPNLKKFKFSHRNTNTVCDKIFILFSF